MIHSQEYFSDTFKPIYLNKVPPPKYYRDINLKRHRFSNLEKETQINFKFILQYISPGADLSLIPTIYSFNKNGTQISVLNYSSSSLSLFKDRHISVNGRNKATFSIEHCYLIAYKTFEYPKIICIEQKNDFDAVPEDRFFISIGKPVFELLISSIFKNNFINDNLFKQIPFQIANVDSFIKTNICMNRLMERIDKKASLKEKPTLTQLLSRFELPSYTILNYTEVAIKIDIKKNIFINNNFIKQLENECYYFIFYHLKDHPELICIEEQNKQKTDPEPRSFISLEYKKNPDQSIFNEIIFKIHKKRAFDYIWKGLYDETSVFYSENFPYEAINIITMKYLELLKL